MKKIRIMKIINLAVLIMVMLGCKTDHSKKKDVEYLFWNASIKTENDFIKEAVKEINQVKGESLVVEKYNSPQSRDQVINFFTKYTGDREIAETILDYSVKYSVPPTLAFALSKAESGFNPKAINRNKITVDRGLFQLNSSTFPEMTPEEFYNIEKNSSKGIKYIRWCLDSGRNEVSALAIYNAGSGRVSGRGTPKMTLNYISKVLGYRTELLNEFYSEVDTFFRIDAYSSKFVKDITKPLDRH